MLWLLCVGCSQNFQAAKYHCCETSAVKFTVAKVLPQNSRPQSKNAPTAMFRNSVNDIGVIPNIKSYKYNHIFPLKRL